MHQHWVIDAEINDLHNTLETVIIMDNQVVFQPIISCYHLHWTTQGQSIKTCPWTLIRCLVQVSVRHDLKIITLLYVYYTRTVKSYCSFYMYHQSLSVHPFQFHLFQVHSDCKSPISPMMIKRLVVNEAWSLTPLNAHYWLSGVCQIFFSAMFCPSQVLSAKGGTFAVLTPYE